MPHSPPHPCSVRWCSAVTRERFCPRHEAEERRRVDERRPNSSVRGYGARWQKLRRAFLQEHARCMCEATYCPHAAGACRDDSTDVDHMLSRRLGGADEWDNLQALCHPCHSRKTILVDGGYGVRAREQGGPQRTPGEGGEISSTAERETAPEVSRARPQVRGRGGIASEGAAAAPGAPGAVTDAGDGSRAAARRRALP
jgi:5-methylcytosine-specific restriction protein A